VPRNDFQYDIMAWYFAGGSRKGISRDVGRQGGQPSLLGSYLPWPLSSKIRRCLLLDRGVVSHIYIVIALLELIDAW
jgi:hypothetical protein